MASLFVLLGLSAAACTGGGEPSPTPTTASSEPGSGVVTTSEDVTYVPGAFEYRFNDITATFTLDGSTGTLSVKNASGAELGDPDMYVLGIDDKRYEGTVTSPLATPDGSESEFEVTFPAKVTSESIGLLVLLFGGKNYGAMAPTPQA